MTDPTALWMTVLGIAFFAAGLVMYLRELAEESAKSVLGLAALGPAFVAAALAAFAGEHFTAAKGMATLVPKWMPAPLFITYFVGVALLCAALSLAARRCVKWAAIGIATMFALFVLTLYLPSAMRHPTIRMVWIFPFREGTFAVGGLALLATTARGEWPKFSSRVAICARFWTAATLMFFGVQNIMYPQFKAGVPDNVPASPWVPFPHVVSYVVGAVLVVLGAAALSRRYSSSAIVLAGMFMALLMVVLFVPDYFLAREAAGYVQALNFIFDTLLFSGTLLVIAKAQDAQSLS